MVTATAQGGRLIEFDGSSTVVDFTLNVSEPVWRSVTAPWRIIGGTASEGVDCGGYFNDTKGDSVTFEARETIRTVSFRVVGDEEPKFDESVVIELFPVPDLDLPGDAAVHQAATWIVDDDGFATRPSPWVSDPVVVEGTGGRREALFALGLSRVSDEDIVIPYRFEDDTTDGARDLEDVTGRVVVPRGTTEARIAIDVVGDRAAEALERGHLVLDLPASVEAAHGGRLTVVDDDASPFPTVLAAPAVFTEFDGSFNIVTFAVSLSEPAAEVVNVPWRILPGRATESLDYGNNFNVIPTALCVDLCP